MEQAISKAEYTRHSPISFRVLRLYNSPTILKMNTVLIPILQMQKLVLREIKNFSR